MIESEMLCVLKLWPLENKCCAVLLSHDSFLFILFILDKFSCPPGWEMSLKGAEGHKGSADV